MNGLNMITLSNYAFVINTRTKLPLLYFSYKWIRKLIRSYRSFQNFKWVGRWSIKLKLFDKKIAQFEECTFCCYLISRFNSYIDKGYATYLLLIFNLLNIQNTLHMEIVKYIKISLYK